MATGIKLGKIGSFELNPRGNIWFKDDTTLGHKLLFKMGWSKGKGLGKNEDGITENIKISKKDNLAGVGYENGPLISVGCVEYESILKKLQQHFKHKEPDSASTLESLEQRSKSSKSRLHYQKFIKGKDLFQCSEKDMKCIFLENPEDLCGISSKNRIDEEITTVKSELSITDYFQQKMQQKLGVYSKTEEGPENMTAEKSYLTLSKKRTISERSDIPKTIKLECEEYINPSKRKRLDIIDSKEVTSDHEKPLFRKMPKKEKVSKIKKLKSCIKNNSTSILNKKRKVSFNENILYESPENCVEMITDHNIPQYNDCNEEFEVNCLQSDIKNSKENEMPLESNEKISKLSSQEMSKLFDDKNKNYEQNQEDQVETDPECLNLPSTSSYNCWLESQRTALKMKLYRNMIKKLKRHKIMSTTNLLDIKGYGNWGFKL